MMFLPDGQAPLLIGLLLATYGTYLESVLFSAEISLTRKGRARMLSLGIGCLKCDLSFFLTTSSSASMWATQQIVLVSQKMSSPDFWPANRWTVPSQSLCLTLKRSYNLGGLTWLTKNSKQSGELSERGDVTVGKPIESL